MSFCGTKPTDHSIYIQAKFSQKLDVGERITTSWLKLEKGMNVGAEVTLEGFKGTWVIAEIYKTWKLTKVQMNLNRWNPPSLVKKGRKPV